MHKSSGLLLGHATFHPYPSDTRRLQCVSVNNPLQKNLKRVYTVYAYLNCAILYC